MLFCLNRLQKGEGFVQGEQTLYKLKQEPLTVSVHNGADNKLELVCCFAKLFLKLQNRNKRLVYGEHFWKQIMEYKMKILWTDTVQLSGLQNIYSLIALLWLHND